MASGAKGIAALFSMYNDEDEDDDEVPPAVEVESPKLIHQSPNPYPNPPDSPSSSPALPPEDAGTSADNGTLGDEGIPSPRPGSSRRASPLPSILSPVELLQRPGSERRAAMAIVDYGHDEFAVSPEPEEGEISKNHAVDNLDAHAQEDQVVSGIPQENSSPGTHNNSPSDVYDKKIDAMVGINELLEEGTPEEVSDPLASFLPPAVSTKCSKELQDKINKFLDFKKQGKSFNAELRNRKDYRNPDFLQHAVRYQNIDEIGSCFSKDIFDPHGYDRSDYYDKIEAEMKREAERRREEKQKSQKIEFVGGGLQPGTASMLLKNSVLGQAAASVDGATKDGRQNRKSKWDKVDGDINPPGSGADSLSAIAKHATILAASNAGSGYSAFLQQKRKEAEEKKMQMERKSS